MALDVFKREKFSHPDVNPMMILLTDGAGNVSLGTRPPQEEAHSLAAQIRDAGIKAVVINMEHAAFDQGLAQLLADKLDAPCYAMAEIKADKLYQAVVRELDVKR
jgi:Mg-chelatase subunit ChlD